VDELSDRELGSSIDGDEEIELALRGLHFGDVDVEEADRIGLERPPRLFVAFHLGQSAKAVALQTAMQRRARQARDCRLQGVEAVVERQQGMPSESDDDGLFLDGQDRRSGLLRSRRHIRDGGPSFPLGDRLLIDSVALRQRPQARLTMLYRSTDRRCRCGAPMKNLAHSATFESLDKNVPSKAGTKHLGSGPIKVLARGRIG
jgi:hypothetical protein